MGFLLCSLDLPVSAQEKKSVIVPLAERSRVPDVRLKTATGEAFKLRPAMQGKWTVLFYFRGKWCPYGRWQIKELRSIENDLLEENVDVLGISPEGFGKTLELTQEFQTGFVFLSDEDFDAGLSMGLMELLPNKEVDNFRMIGALLMEMPQGGVLLPRSGVWLISPEGLVSFARSPEDPKDIMKAPDLLQVIRQEKAKAAVRVP